MSLKSAWLVWLLATAVWTAVLLLAAGLVLAHDTGAAADACIVLFGGLR